MRIQDFQKIAQQEGRVVIDKESKELKTSSVRGRIATFIKGLMKSENSSLGRSTEVKTAFLKAIKDSGGESAFRKAEDILKNDTKPLTSRRIRQVLQETTNVVRTNHAIEGNIRLIAVQTLKDLLLPQINKPNFNDQVLTKLILQLKPESREAQALVALGTPFPASVIDEAFPDLNQAGRNWLTENVSNAIRKGNSDITGLKETVENLTEKRYFNLQAGDLMLLLGGAGLTNTKHLDPVSESFIQSIEKFKKVIRDLPSGRLQDAITTASNEELSYHIVEALLTWEERSGDRKGHIEQTYSCENTRQAVTRLIEVVRSHTPSIQRDLVETSLPGNLVFNGAEYRRETLIGEGAGAKVFRYLSEGKENLVVKQIKGEQTSSGFEIEIRNHRFVNEVSGENGAKYFSKLEGVARDEEGSLFIIMREEPKGSLKDLARKGLIEKAVRLEQITEEEGILIQKSLILHLLQGAVLMRNELGMMHRDVKPENIFISGEGYPKFADFGESIQTSIDRTGEGTKTFVYADTISDTVESGTKIKDVSDDGFSLAISIYELVKGIRPLNDNPLDLQKHIEKNFGLKLNEDLSTGFPALDQILFELTKTDVSGRSTVEDVMNSDFFNEVRDSKEEHLRKLAEIL